jgi:hypothetical protein
MHFLYSSVNNRCVKIGCFTLLHPLPLQARRVGTHLVRTMSDMHSAVFNAGHRVGASCEFTLGGPFDHRDVVVPPVVGWKRQCMVEIYNFFNNILCSVIA